MIGYPHTLRPPFWAHSGHAQTLIGHILPSPGAAIGTDSGHAPIGIELPDGDQLIAFALAPRGAPRGVRIHLFHGLSGDVNSEYMRRTAELLCDHGFEVWAVNHRGCGEGEGLARGTYHSGKIEDMQAVLAASRAASPNRNLRHVVVGFSLSGNIALLLSSKGLQPAPDAVIAINPPMDLAAAAVDIQQGLNRIYELRFLRRLCKTMDRRVKAGLLDKPLPISPTMSLAAFDDAVTAPLGGFASGADYYERCSTHKRLGEITTPTVIITTRDDPFVTGATLTGLSHSPSVHLHVEDHGGHVGYLNRGRHPLSWKRWLDGAVLHYVMELMAEIEH
jgi:predicted alpha/beta-fold hydrolase